MKRLTNFSFLTALLLSTLSVSSQKTFKSIDAESRVPGSEKIVMNEKNNSLSFVVMKNGSFIDESRHLDWLRSTVLKLNSDYELVLYKKEKDELGFTHYRYKELYKGVKVEHGVYYVHAKDGKVVSANGEIYSNISSNLLSVTARINKNDALAKAKSLFNSNDVNDLSKQKGALTILFRSNTPFLCYHFEISSDAPLKHSEIYVDAQTNKIILELNKIHTSDVPGSLTTQYNGVKSVTIDQVSGSQYRLQQSAKNIYTKNCNSGSNLASAVDFTNPTSTWTASAPIDKAVFDLYYGLEKSYDYYNSKFGRNSYDGVGTQVKGIAHYGSGYNNAFWNGTYMVFGDGDGFSYNPFSCTDIVGHELTHAVTETSAGLVYMNESGGLNESFSDIFGVAIDFYANPATANFLEGEQCSVTNTPFRNMINPKLTFQPTTYLGQYWVPSGGTDNGGVHTNSQVQNHWFYLLCQGGTGTNDNSIAYNISGVGMANAEKIAFRNLTNYLTPNSTYADARTYAIQSAVDLFGGCSNIVTQCANAWYAVGVGSGLYSNAVVSEFSSNNNYSCAIPASISFANNSLNSSSYIWYFGDGTTSTSANPVHSYTAVGNYHVKLKAIGTSSCNTTDSITKNNFVTITNVGMPVTACIPVQGNNAATYGITKVEFGSISKTSTNASEGYKDFMCTNQAALIAGDPYLLKITTQSPMERVAVWIDYNNDGILNSSNELILYSLNTLNNITTHTIVVQTPVNVTLNTPLRLRVTDDYNSITGSCVTHSYGQTEDYTVRFSAASVKPQANFFSNTKVTQVNGSINFFDSTLNAATSWRWNFQGGTPSISNTKNPTVMYSAPGTYSVKLVATNAFGSDSLFKIGYINVVNTFTMCAGTNSTSAVSGNIYDSGGPSGNYQNYENCQFLINTGCTGTVSLTFSQFNLESCCDYFSVYNGTNTAAPLLGTYNGTTIPPTLNANSGKMLLVWTTDGSVTYAGFSATWSSVISGTTAPVANFSVNPSPALNVPIQFTDQTTNAPYQWLWQFDDGTTSANQNAIKTYTTSGVKTVTLTATNCSTTSIVTKTLSVQGPATISVTPNPINAVASCGGSVIATATISNLGSGDLQYNITNQTANSNINLLFVTSYIGTNELANMNSILSSVPNCTITNHTLSNVTNFQNALVGKTVLVIPELQTISTGIISTYSASIINFVNGGGLVITCGNNTNINNEIGLFPAGIVNVGTSGTMNVLDTTDLITKTLPLSINMLNATFYSTFTGGGFVDLVKFGTNSVVSKKAIGAGKAIFIGYDYFATDVNASKILSNAVKSNASSVPWLSISPTSGTASASGTSTIGIQFNTTNLASGVYTTNIVINSNDLTTPSYSLPVSYTVTGAASASVSASCINFGTIMQYTTKKDSVMLYNTGCSTMSVSSISTVNSAYTYTPSTSFTIAPWSNKKIYVKFSPLTAGAFNDTLTILSNGGNSKICLNGTVTPAPLIVVNPASLTASATCGSNSTATLSITNNGGSNLTYTATGSSTGANIKVLVITNLVYPNYISNMLSALNTYSVNYTVTQHTLTNAAALQTALSGKDIVIFPQPYNGTLYTNGFFQTYSVTVSNFVNGGGTALMSGFYNTNMMNDLGLFTSTVNGSTGSGSTFSVIDTNNVITRGLPLGNITSFGYNYNHTFSNSGVSNYITYSGSSMLSKRSIGSGRAIYVGFDYQVTNSNEFNKVLANSVKSSVSSAPWLSGAPTTSTVTPSSTTIMTFTFNSTGLASGTYSSVVSVNSNDPLTPTYTVPVMFNVSGSATSSVSANCKNFGNIVQYTSKTDSLILYNIGCSTMNVTSLSTSNAAYTYTPSASFTIAPYSNKKIYVKFNPSTVGIINDSLRIINNGGNQTICLSGTVTGAPSITLTPSSLSATISACNNVQTADLAITNIGSSNLTYTLNANGGSSTATNDFLIIDHYRNGKANFNPHTTQLVTESAFTSLTLNQLKNNKVIYFEPMWTNYSNIQANMTNLTNYVSQGGVAVINIAGNNGSFNDIAPLGADYDRTNTHDAETIPDNTHRYISGQGYGGAVLTAANFNSWSTTDHGNLFGYPANATVVLSNSNGPSVIQYPVGNGYVILTTLTFGWGNSSSILNPHKNIIEYAYYLSQTAIGSSWLSTPTTTGVVTASASNTVTYTFNSGTLPAGTYTSSIVISSNDPLTPTYTVPVTMVVGSNPCANFSYTNSNNCTGVVTFTNTTVNAATSYSWNFGNGSTSSATNPTVTYASAGTYSISLTACTNGSCSTTTKTLNISGVGGPLTNSCTPISNMFGSNYGIVNVNFNTINKSSGFSNPEGYQDFSCNNQTTLTLGSTYSLVVTTSSSYYENVSAWIDFDNNGAFAPSEQIMTSLNKLMTHTLSFTPPGSAVLNTPLRMRITDEYSGYTITSACYNSNYGQSEDYTIKIQPNNAPPIATFSTQTNSCQGTVNFTDNSLNNPTSWLWNFGDGNASSSQNTSHTYSSAGTYTVLLIASNAYGSNYTSQVVTVNPLLFNIGVNGLMAINQPLTYTTSLNGGLSYTWDFGDGSLSGIQTATHNYTAAGTYTVKLTIISGGCVATKTITVVISTNVGLTENNVELFGINVYPNPFNTYTTLKLNLREDAELNIEILNALGQHIKNLADKKTYEKGEYSFSTDHLAKGVYFLKVNYKQKVYIYKLISLE